VAVSAPSASRAAAFSSRKRSPRRPGRSRWPNRRRWRSCWSSKRSRRSSGGSSSCARSSSTPTRRSRRSWGRASRTPGKLRHRGPVSDYLTEPLRRQRAGESSGRTPAGGDSVGAVASEMPKTVGVGVEEDALDPTLGHREQDRRKWPIVVVEDQRRLAVELAPLDLEFRPTGGRGHESSHLSGARQRPAQVAHALEDSTLGPAVRDQHGVRGEELGEGRGVSGFGRAQERVQETLVLLARGGDQATAFSDPLTRAREASGRPRGCVTRDSRSRSGESRTPRGAAGPRARRASGAPAPP
jgi:hypothetical protein